jgi:hypothetical protein
MLSAPLFYYAEGTSLESNYIQGKKKGKDHNNNGESPKFKLQREIERKRETQSSA